MSILFDYKNTIRFLLPLLSSSSTKVLQWLGRSWISIGPIQNQPELLYHIKFIYNNVS